jgi:hypothetical protein
MGSKCALVVAFGLAVVTLCGCGAVDSNVTYLPETFRQSGPKTEIEELPDVHLIVRNNIFAVFTTASSPTNISVSSPIPARHGGWNACIRASVHGATGRSIGTQTYLMNIENKQIGRRERVDDNHWCAKEAYESL